MTYTWIPFYKELALALLQLKNDRKSLVDFIYSELSTVSGKSLVDYIHMKDGSKVRDIDPFSVFAIFNRSLKIENRVSFLQKFKDKFNLKSEIPTDFNGIPTVNSQRAFFFNWADKNAESIRQFWELFESAVLDKDISNIFDKMVNKTISQYSLTIILYWIAPDKFLNLDGKNRLYLSTFGLPENYHKLDYFSYSKLMQDVRQKMDDHNIPYSSFPELSYAAFKNTSEKGEGKKNDSNYITYWTYSPGENASEWSQCVSEGIMCVGWDFLGDLSQYPSREEMQDRINEQKSTKGSAKNASLAVWQFSHEMKPGDIVFAKKGLTKIIGKGIVESDYIFDTSRSRYNHIRKVHWTHIGEWTTEGQQAMKTLTNITRYTDYVKKLNNLVEEGNIPSVSKSKGYEAYNRKNFLEEVFVTPDAYDQLESLLLRKKNLILMGAPGIGKTYAARRLAYAIMGERDESRVEQVQFHQNYSYEDFVIGYKPNEKGGFELREGIFYQFCKRAQVDKDHKYFFIIDEINRGNLSKIFGELLMLIEKDYRDNPIHLAYTNESFSVPSNLHLIGMMNTADRSLAMIDYALRRRFSFFEMEPGFEAEAFKKHIMRYDTPRLKKLIQAIKELNVVIKKDDSLGSGFQIGHSYLCNLESDNDLKSIVEYDIIPMLREYWFDNDNTFNQEAQKLRDTVK